MLQWLKENWAWIVGLLSSFSVGFFLNPIGYLRRLWDRTQDQNISTSIRRNRTIREEMQQMNKEIIALQSEVRMLGDRLHLLELEKASLNIEVDSLRSENHDLRSSNESLRAALDECERARDRGRYQ